MNDSAIHDVREWTPPSWLRDHAVCAWEQHVSPTSAPFVHRRAPTGSVEIAWTVGSTPRIIGPQTGPLSQLLTPGATIIGLRLRPEAAGQILGIPASELLDQNLDVAQLWANHAPKLEDDLGQTRSGRAAADVLERFIRTRIPEQSPDPVMAEAVRHLTTSRQAAIATLARSLFVSERQFRRRSEAATGLAPKMLHGILRFHRFLALAWTLDQSPASLEWLATAAGYADQSHLTREAVRWAGRSPSQLLDESQRRRCCKHDHRASYQAALNGAYCQPT